MAGIFGSAASSLLRAQQAQVERAERARRQQQEEEDRATAAQQREIQQAALLASFREQGIVPKDEAQDFALPMFDGLASGMPSGASMPMPASARYKPLGGSGFVLDTENSRGAQQRVQQHEAERRQRAVAEAQAKIAAAEDERRLAREQAMERLRHGNTMQQIGARNAGDLRAAQVRAENGRAKEAPGEKMTEGERRGSALLTMALDAAPILREATAPSRRESWSAAIGMNEALSGQRQVVEQAAQQVVSSYLYLVSGATATDDEIKRQAQALVPQPGDKEPVLKRKKQALETMLRAMTQAAGRGAPPNDPTVQQSLDASPRYSPDNPFANRPPRRP
jgi:hypothetical protein